MQTRVPVSESGRLGVERDIMGHQTNCQDARVRVCLVRQGALRRDDKHQFKNTGESLDVGLFIQAERIRRDLLWGTRLMRTTFDVSICKGCSNLCRVTFGPSSSLARIGVSCFAGTQVEEMGIPNSVCELCDGVFQERLPCPLLPLLPILWRRINGAEASQRRSHR